MKYISILFAALCVIGCELQEAVMPIDFPVIIEDTTSLPIVVCDTVVVTEPKFITGYVELESGYDSTQIFTHQWLPGQEYESIDQVLIVLGYHPDSIEVYTSDSAVAFIVRGTNDKSKITGKIFTRDLAQKKHAFVGQVQYLVFGGALTFEEYKSAAERFPSVNGFNFRRCYWTQAQLEEVATIILGECKLGRYWADFMFNAHPISDSLYCKFFERDWQIVRGQTLNCQPPEPIYNIERA